MYPTVAPRSSFSLFQDIDNTDCEPYHYKRIYSTNAKARNFLETRSFGKICALIFPSLTLQYCTRTVQRMYCITRSGPPSTACKMKFFGYGFNCTIQQVGQRLKSHGTSVDIMELYGVLEKETDRKTKKRIITRPNTYDSKNRKK